MQAALESGYVVVRKAIAKGVKIAVRTDAGVYPHGRNVEEFHLLTAHGLSLLDALRTGTSVIAELVGGRTPHHQGQQGRLARGRVLVGAEAQEGLGPARDHRRGATQRAQDIERRLLKGRELMQYYADLDAREQKR
jgi:hypothetical protein